MPLPSARLFWAVPIDIPQPLRDLMTELERWRTQLKITRPEQLHLTLKFLGDTPAERIAAVSSAADGLPAVSVSLGCCGLGVFPPRGRPNVLWAGLTGAEPLVRLAAELDQAMSGLGYAPERRPFHPHLTLARLKAGMPRPMWNWYDRHHEDHFGDVKVQNLVLYQSRLTPQGSIYTERHRVPL